MAWAFTVSQRPYSRTAEFLDALMPLLDGKPTDVQGDQVFAKGWLAVDAAPGPVLLTALGPRMLELAGRVTASSSVGSTGPRTIVGHIAPTLNAAAERADRPPPRIVTLVTVCVIDDPEAVRAQRREAAELYDSFPSYRLMLNREGVASGADLILAGTFDDIVEGLTSYVDAGATDLRIANTACNDDERQATREALGKGLDPTHP